MVEITDTDEHTLVLNLNDCTTLKHFQTAQILCTNQLGKTIIIDSKVSCELKNIELSNFSGFFRFILLNGSVNTQKFKDSISFIAPDKVVHVYVEMNGSYKNEKLCLSSGYTRTFVTYDGYKQNRKDFSTYLAALIGFVLLTIPSIYNTWKKFLSKK
ncbi:MAG: hypothetical protein WC755_03625 [Candidatus Woesearchaeota archaeon]